MIKGTLDIEEPNVEGSLPLDMEHIKEIIKKWTTIYVYSSNLFGIDKCRDLLEFAIKIKEGATSLLKGQSPEGVSNLGEELSIDSEIKDAMKRARHYNKKFYSRLTVFDFRTYCDKFVEFRASTTHAIDELSQIFGKTKCKAFNNALNKIDDFYYNVAINN